MAELRLFFAYELEDAGERKESFFSEKDLGQYLSPEQVLVLVREDLRRIFIWKGAISPVKKRFLGSKVARELCAFFTRTLRSYAVEGNHYYYFIVQFLPPFLFVSLFL